MYLPLQKRLGQRLDRIVYCKGIAVPNAAAELRIYSTSLGTGQLKVGSSSRLGRLGHGLTETTPPCNHNWDCRTKIFEPISRSSPALTRLVRLFGPAFRSLWRKLRICTISCGGREGPVSPRPLLQPALRFAHRPSADFSLHVCR